MRWRWGLVLLAGCDQLLGVTQPPAFHDAAVPAEAALDPGLIGWWKLDDGAGVIAVDSTAYRDDGDLTAGVTWTSSSRGTAADIDGKANQSIDLGVVPLLALTGSMTLAAWVNAAGLTHDFTDNAIIAYDNGADTDSGWMLKATIDCDSTLTFAIQIADPTNHSVEQCSNTTPVVGTWYHVAGVFDATAMTLNIYVDGATDDGGTVGTVPASQKEPNNIHIEIGNADPGNAVSGGMSAFDGLIQDVRIYNRALGAAEIATLAGVQ